MPFVVLRLLICNIGVRALLAKDQENCGLRHLYLLFCADNGRMHYSYYNGIYSMVRLSKCRDAVHGGLLPLSSVVPQLAPLVSTSFILSSSPIIPRVICPS